MLSQFEMRCKYFICLLLAFSLSLALVSAISEDTCVNAVVTSINPSSVDANEDFTVGIEIDNCGEQIPENITFELTSVSPEISVNEPLLTEIGALGYANSKRFILYHMRTSPNIPPGVHYIEAELRYGSLGFLIKKEYNFSITVETNEPELSISGSKTSPDRIAPKDDIILTLKVENSGKGSAKNVRVRLESLDFEGVKEAYLGEVEPNEELPARFVLRASEAGTKDFIAKIFYQYGSEDKMVQFPMGLQVFSKSNYLWFVIPGAIILIILVLWLYLKTNHNHEDEE